MNELHVIVASHNRAATTHRALASLDVAAAEADLSYDVTLFDDGSTDETVAAATAAVKNLTVLRGDGSAFWARSMAAAEDEVLSRDDVQDGDWLLWFNDDVVLAPAGLRKMIEAASASPVGILVGSTVDRESGLLTYGGLRRSGVHPLAFDLVEPPAAPDEGARADAFNGNVVLMPVHVARAVGAIDGAFSHAFADVDYGSRAVAKGVPIIVAGGVVGFCSRNPTISHSSSVAAWRAYTGRKGAGNPRALRRYLRRHSPRSWWFFFASSYGLWWMRTIRRSLGPRRVRP